jgi:acetyltransferase-like isoleucine patch superfamily enzyme
MLKKILILLFKIIGNLSSYVYSFKTSQKFLSLRDILYTAWVSREFKSIGVGSILHSNLLIIGGKFITIGDNCSIGSRSVLTVWNKHEYEIQNTNLIIGNNVSIGADSHITAINRIQICDNVLTGKKITITDNAHGDSKLATLLLPTFERKLYSSGPVIIEENVWLGDKVTILPNVRIGKNSIIGSNAVVTKDIPSNCIAGGIPARVLKLIE